MDYFNLYFFKVLQKEFMIFFDSKLFPIINIFVDDVSNRRPIIICREVFLIVTHAIKKRLDI